MLVHINSIEDIEEDPQTESESIFSTLTFRVKFQRTHFGTVKEKYDVPCRIDSKMLLKTSI